MHIKVLIVFGFAWAACKQPGVSVPHVYMHAETQHLYQRNGVMMLDIVPFSGYVFQLYPDGDTNFVYGYLNGLQEGVSKQWYEKRQSKEIRFYHEGKKTGIHIGWWPNGNVKFKYRFVNDLYEGNCKEWHVNGMLYRNNNYEMGHEKGLQQAWFDDGSVQANYETRNGRNYGNTGMKHCKSIYNKDTIGVNSRH
ncbi:MAG: membrane-binding protein [Bacteroidota bacterium]